VVCGRLLAALILRVAQHAARETSAVDATGAGDALAAGFLVGGVDLALAAAARCVGQRGAQP
jgi:sugar/nucleoside kinase (ribokinase family)